MLSWFPYGRDNETGWRLDVVSLLAVIGEATMANHAQPLTSTWLCLLPRLIPAPQALLKSKRPTRLPAKQAIVVGVFSGTRVDEFNFYADLIHKIGTLRPFQFQECTITRKHTPDVENDAARTSKLVFMRFLAPLNVITICSCLATMLLIVWSCLVQDGVAAISLALLSLTSSLVGVALWWEPQLSRRQSKGEVVPGDVVIRTREGAFIVVHCSDEIARELYTGTEEATYHLGQKRWKALVGVATVTLMVAVVLLGNSTWAMQAAIGGTYLVLNGAYWVAALLPQTWTWDISHYEVTDAPNQNCKTAHLKGDDGVAPSFTRTLWYAIQATGRVRWVFLSNAAPSTESWEEWTRLAYEHRMDPNWDAIGEKDRLMADAAKKLRDEEHFDLLSRKFE